MTDFQGYGFDFFDLRSFKQSLKMAFFCINKIKSFPFVYCSCYWYIFAQYLLKRSGQHNICYLQQKKCLGDVGSCTI